MLLSEAVSGVIKHGLLPRINNAPVSCANSTTEIDQAVNVQFHWPKHTKKQQGPGLAAI
jgi:hypothetical protein